MQHFSEIHLEKSQEISRIYLSFLTNYADVLKFLAYVKENKSKGKIEGRKGWLLRFADEADQLVVEIENLSDSYASLVPLSVSVKDDTHDYAVIKKRIKIYRDIVHRIVDRYSEGKDNSNKLLMATSLHYIAINDRFDSILKNSADSNVIFFGKYEDKLEERLVQSVAIGTGSLLFVFLIITFLSRSITLPIVNLTKNIKQIGESYDYSLLVTKETDDELGELAVSFNHMLSQIGLHKDELENAKIELFKQKTFLDTLIENMPMAIIVKDVRDDYRYVAFNNHAEEIFGIKAEDIIGTFDYDHFPKEEADYFRRTDEKVIKEGNLVNVEQEPVTTKSKGTFIAQTFKMPIFDQNGEPLFLLGVLHDVTDRINEQEELKFAKEEAENSNQAKSSFLANMSHELRTPLNSILGMTQMFVEDKDLSEDNRSMAGTVYNSANSLLEIVNDILDISKVEAGSMVLEEISFNFKDMVAGVMETMASVASAKGVSLRYYYEKDEALYLIGDPLRVSRILMNLISNAIKYTEEGGVTLTVDYTNCDNGKIEISCVVKDTGVGIAEDKQQEIFNKFTQADLSTTRKYGGTGLGLAITKDLVELMDGSVGVKSTVGEGSTFWFKIPFIVTDHIDDASDRVRGKRKKTKRDDNIKRISADEVRVLVAEDHLLNQNFISRLLKRIGISCYEIMSDGVLAFKAYQTEEYDIILMDCHMPEQNGYETTQHIREQEKLLGGHIPIIALTADAMEGTRDKCLESGMDEYITKPIDFGEFKNVLEQWVIFSEEETEDETEKDTPDEEEVVNLPVDLTVLNDYVDSPDEMSGFIELFVKQGDIDIQVLVDNCANEESNDWVDASHRFKGSAGVVGATRLQNLCAQAQEMDTSSAQDKSLMLKIITKEYNKVKLYLEKELY